ITHAPRAMSAPTSQPKPKGWLIGVGVLCITLAVIAGLIAIAVVAKRKQRYRITEPSASLTPPPPTKTTLIAPPTHPRPPRRRGFLSRPCHSRRPHEHLLKSASARAPLA